MTDYSISSTTWNIGDTITVTSSNATGFGFTGWIINFNENDYDYGLKDLDSRGKLFAISNSPNNTLDVDIIDAHSRIYTLTPVTITVGIPQQIGNAIKPISECLELSQVTVNIGTTITVTMNHNIYTKLKYLINRWTRYKEDMSNKVTNISSSSTHTQYPSAKLMYNQLETKENSSNKVTSVSSSSTDTQYPSAKCVYNGLNGKENSSNKSLSVSPTSTDVEYPTSGAVYREFEYERRDKTKDLIIRTKEITGSPYDFTINTHYYNAMEETGSAEYWIEWGDGIKEKWKNGRDIYRVYETINRAYTITISPITTYVEQIGIECFSETSIEMSSITIPSTVQILYEDCFGYQTFDELTVDLDTLYNTIVNESIPVNIETDILKFYSSTFDSEKWEYVNDFNTQNLGGNITVISKTLIIDDGNIVNNNLTNDYPYSPISSQTVNDGLNTKVDKNIKITANTDLNTLTSVGFYSCTSNQTVSTLSNCPTVYSFTLSVELNGAYGNGVKQVLTEYGSTKTWIRVFYTNNDTLVTTGWKRIYTEEDLGWKTASLTNMSGCTLYYNEMFCVLKFNGTAPSYPTAKSWKNVVSGTIPSTYRPPIGIISRGDGTLDIFFQVTTDGVFRMVSRDTTSSSFGARVMLIWARV